MIMEHRQEMYKKCIKLAEDEYIKCVQEKATKLNHCLISKTLTMTFCLHEEKPKLAKVEVCGVREPPP